MWVRRYNKFIVFLFIAFLFFGCNSKSNYQINVDNIELELEINRFDEVLIQLDEKHYDDQLVDIGIQYPAMFQVFVEQIAMAGRIEDSLFSKSLHAFFFDKYTQELYQDCQQQYKDLDDIEEELEDAYKHLLYYYPKIEVPEFYSIISNFGVAAASFENIMMFSLDYYLGADYHYYEGLFPKYKSKKFSKAYLSTDILKVEFGKLYAEDEFSGNNLLSKMIYEGKKLFFLELMIPQKNDSILIGYSKNEIKWCEKNEGKIWNQILLSKVLYETQAIKISRYIDDGPFTNAYGIPSDSPAQLGVWLGWQIVRNYVTKNEIKDFRELFEEKDEQKILMKSAYKPKV